MKPLEQRIGRKLYAYEPIYQFNTGEHVFTRGTGLGIIKKVTPTQVFMYLQSNPISYRYYAIKREKVEYGLETGELKIR